SAGAAQIPSIGQPAWRVRAMGVFFFSLALAAMSPKTARTSKFSKMGAFINSWGTKDTAPAILLTPPILPLAGPLVASLLSDTALGGVLGSIYVADRLNSRIQVFDQDGNFITAWSQFGQPSSVFVGPDDKIYVGVAFRDEATRRNPTSRVQPGELRGIMVGSAIDGSLLAFIPDP